MRSLLVAGICLVLSACSMFTRSVERPTATVRTVDVTSAGLTGVTGELRLDISNPNAFGVPLSGIDWQLSIGGSRAVTGTVSLSQTIPARGVAPVMTSLTIDARDAIAVAAELAGGARDYQIALELRFSTPVGPLDVGVQHRGQLGDAGALLGLAN
jgi:LEA14-like dessication related protein